MATHNGEDKALERLLGDSPPGFYVDVGANDPYTSSNSHPFYLRGWRGIDIEPIPELAQKLREAHPENRVFDCAVGHPKLDGLPNTLLRLKNHELSSLRRDIIAQHSAEGFGEPVPLTVKMRSLNSIFSECGVTDIGFISLDVEGSEAEALAGLDLARYHPLVLCIEATLPNTTIPSHEEWEPYVLSRGYRLAHFDGYNRFYVL